MWNKFPSRNITNYLKNKSLNKNNKSIPTSSLIYNLNTNNKFQQAL